MVGLGFRGGSRGVVGCITLNMPTREGKGSGVAIHDYCSNIICFTDIVL